MKLKYWIVLVIEIIIFLLINSIITLFNLNILINYFLSGLLTCLLLPSIIYNLWDNYIWKCQWVYNFINFFPPHNFIPPNLNGDWNVTSKSSYKGTITKGTAIIKQNMNNINININFPDSDGESTVASILKHNGDWIILYNYINQVNADNKLLEPHTGYSLLNIKVQAKGKITIEGRYANNKRETSGQISFTR